MEIVGVVVGDNRRVWYKHNAATLYKKRLLCVTYHNATCHI